MFKAIFAGVVAVIVLILVFSTAISVQQTERGVVTRFGEFQKVVEPGFHLVNPFTTDVHIVETAVQALPFEEQTYSSDGQVLDVQYTVNYHVNPMSVEALYKEVNRNYESVYVLPKARQALKEVFSKYTAQGVIENRGKLSEEVANVLRAYPELTPKGLVIDSVAIANIDFDDRYEEAIQNKQVQEQAALAQVNITKQEEEKKKQEILKAEALAEKTRLEVQALSTSQGGEIIEKLKAEAQLEAAKRWNGVLPTNMYGSAPIPLINI